MNVFFSLVFLRDSNDGKYMQNHFTFKKSNEGHVKLNCFLFTHMKKFDQLMYNQHHYPPIRAIGFVWSG